MAYVACTTGTVALYPLPDDGGTLALPVEAWDERGIPHIAGDTGLVEASSRPGFLRLEAAAVALPPSRVPVTPVPAGPRPKPKGPKERPGA